MALRAAAETYWYAEGTDRAELEHRFLHELGYWTRKNFGCQLNYEDGQYSTACPVKLADKRIGVSPGLLTKAICSICGEDISECKHRQDRLYWVSGGPTSHGPCRVCLEKQCDHSPDEFYQAEVVRMLKIVRMLEISFVDVPADPLARLTKLNVGTDDQMRQWLSFFLLLACP